MLHVTHKSTKTTINNCNSTWVVGHLKKKIKFTMDGSLLSSRCGTVLKVMICSMNIHGKPMKEAGS